MTKDVTKRTQFNKLKEGLDNKRKKAPLERQFH